MRSWRAANRKRSSARRWDPVCCPKHGVPYRGAGWAYAAGYRFAVFECPKTGCNSVHLLPGEPE